MCASTLLRPPSRPLPGISSAVLAVLLATGAAGAADWPQFNLDARHSGFSMQETALHAGNVATLQKVYSVALPAVADGAPAFLAGVQTAGGVKDLLFLTTKDGRILAVDAATGSIVWSKQPATTPRYTTAMPAIDPSRLYVYSYALDGKVHKYQVGDGTEITTGGWPEVATLKPDVEKSSPGLTVATVADGTQYLYVANGGYPGDAGDYQGHITAINLATGAQKVFNAACSNQTVHFVENSTPDCVGHVQTAIWARSGVVYDSDNDKLFMATGNGDYDGGHEWGDSVFALHPDGTGSNGLPVDSYTPTEFQHLQDVDADLGSTAPVVLPKPPGSNIAHLGLQSGKDAQLRLLNLDNLSGSGGPGHTGGEIQKISLPQGSVVLTAPAAWTDPADGSTWVFVGNGAGLAALQVGVAKGGAPSLTSKWTTTGVGGSSPLLANGILYWATGNRMRAINPRTGALLWSDATFGGVHWESPIVVQGRLYATDEVNGAGKLWAWAPAAAPPLDFYTLTPCRAVDTRQVTGPSGGPALAGGGARRSFPITGQCGVPSDAQAVAVNVTVVSPAGAGDLRLGPSGFAAQTSALTFGAGQTRANNAVVGLTGDPLGALGVQADLAGTADLVVDVVGYFK
jgi:PQQ-like domain